MLEANATWVAAVNRELTEFYSRDVLWRSENKTATEQHHRMVEGYLETLNKIIAERK